MRILHVSSHYPPTNSGGAERACQSLAHAQRELRHEVHVAAPVPAHDDGGVAVHALPAPAPRVLQKLLLDYASPAATAALRHIVAEVRPDVVHVHNVYGIGSRAVRMLSRDVPTVLTLHDYWPMDIVAPSYDRGHLRYPARGYALAAWTLLHRRWHAAQLAGAELFAPSRFLAQRVGRTLQRRIAVIPNGVAMPASASDREDRILFVGRIAPEKGLAEALPAIVAAAETAGWQVDVVGDGPLLPSLRRQYRTVHWHGRSDPAPFYARARILVVPSVWPENAPLVVLEGMAQGLAVIAAAAGGIPEMIDDGVSGALFSPGDVPQLQKQVRRLIDDEELRTNLANAAREVGAERSWSAAATSYIAAYDAAAEARRDPLDVTGATTRSIYAPGTRVASPDRR